MYKSLVLQTAPATAVVTLAECKSHLRITASDEDTYVQSLLDAAISFVDGTGVLGKALITQTWRQYVGQNPGVVALLLGPVQGVSAIGYFDSDGASQAATVDDFNVFGVGDCKTVEPKSGSAWPAAQDRPDAIWIDYTTGYGDVATDVPAGLVHAIKMLVAHWYENREPAPEANQTKLPFGFDDLISVHRGNWYG